MRERAMDPMDEVRANDPAVVPDPWQTATVELDTVRQLIPGILELEGNLADAARWHFASPGKQTRARLALASCLALEVELPAARWAALATQLLHEASLIHDDVQDGDMLRRGRQAVWSRFGSDVAVNLGDALIAASFDAVSRAGEDGRCIRDLSWAVRASACGQASEMAEKCAPGLSLERYEELARGKTGPLLALPVVLAMRLGGLADETVRRTRSALETFGTAYQVYDDLADVLGLKGRGAAGADLREGKRSAPILHLLAIDPRADRLVAAGLGPDAPDSGRMRVLTALHASGALEATVGQLDSLLANAHQGLRTLPVALRWTLVSAFRDLGSAAHAAGRLVRAERNRTRPEAGASERA